MNTSAVNIPAVCSLLTKLADLGVCDVVVCAGARNSPLVAVLDRTIGFRVHSFFEERSAAFFALGRARREQTPAAVITTSGTAAAQLLPAAIEAFHTGVPLILITADRPRRLRGTGAPQTIDQTGLFAKFVETEVDIEAGEELHTKLSAWRGAGPLHINFCLDEPLLDAAIEPLVLQPIKVDLHFPQAATVTEMVSTFFSASRKPVAVVGAITSSDERDAVEAFLVSTGVPVYLEATSGLRESPRLAKQALRSGDKVLTWALKHKEIDGVIRLGGVPTVRIWRELDESTSDVHVLSVCRWPFSGLSRGEFVTTSLTALRPVEKPVGDVATALIEKDHAASAFLNSLLKHEPLSEPSLVQGLSETISPDALTYVGNSLPIREWDLAATYSRPHWIQASRGVNGIDGQTSTFLGLMPEAQEGWCIIGDLTALYDLTAPWALRESTRARIVVINNGGGKIFSRIFDSALFENRHSLGFESWAKMWNLPYEKWSDGIRDVHSNGPIVIELAPDAAATKRFWDAYDAFWAKP